MKWKIFLATVAFIFSNGVLANGGYEYGGHTYYYTSYTTWSNAEAEAVGMGGHLVSINDAAEQTFINGLLSGSTWIGFTDEGTNVWEWVNGDPVTYTNWATYEPNGGASENCGVAEGAWGGLWNDLPCDRINLGIIEIVSNKVSCVGFAPPMEFYPVSVRKNQALPLKAEIFDAEGYAMTDYDLASPPVVEVWYEYGTPEADDVSDEALPAGMGDDGNQFIFTEIERWQYNLRTKNHTAPGTYTVFMKSGDISEYVLEEPTCTTKFVVK